MRSLHSMRLVLAAMCLTLGLAVQAEGPPAAGGGDVVVVVSPSNPVQSLSRNQVIDLFLGRSSQFPDGRRAVPVDQPEGSATRNAFNSRVLGRSTAQVRAHWAKIIFTGRGRPPADVADGVAVKRLVAGDPNLIGYIDRSLVDDSVAVVELR